MSNRTLAGRLGWHWPSRGRTFTIFVLFFWVAGCANLVTEPAHPLEQKTWGLQEIYSSLDTPVILTADQSRNHTLSFERGNSLLLQLGCNKGTADWTAADPHGRKGALAISSVASTQALCPDASYGEELVTDLPKASNYILSHDGSKLWIATQYTLFSFTDIS